MFHSTQDISTNHTGTPAGKVGTSENEQDFQTADVTERVGVSNEVLTTLLTYQR